MFRVILLFLIFAGVLAFLLSRKTLHAFRLGLRRSLGERTLLRMMQTGDNAQAFIESIPRYAARHVEQIKKSFREDLHFQKSDLRRLDDVIENAWDNRVPKDIDALVLAFGSYFGETIRRLRGGVWEYDSEKGYCLRDVGGVATVYPFEKVRKRFINGRKESLAVFYQALVKKLDATDA